MKKLYRVYYEPDEMFVLAEDDGVAEDIGRNDMSCCIASEELDEDDLTHLLDAHPSTHAKDDDGSDLPLRETAAQCLKALRKEAAAQAVLDANMKLFPDVNPKPLAIEGDEEDGEAEDVE